MRIKLTVAYDGTGFCGWAPSPNTRTVHRVLTEAILESTRQAVDIVGASRTDSGTHARGQVCHFDTDLTISGEKWQLVLNRILPPDVAVVAGETVGEDFHSRFCAEDRSYEYRIHTQRPDPFTIRYCHAHPVALDLKSMQRAAALLVGNHDFLAFTEELDPSVENTVRELREVVVSQRGDEIVISVVGTAFLRGMMRRMSGGLVEVGRGQRSEEEFARLLTSARSEMQWPVVLPAKGLCLMRVRYGDPPRDCRVTKSSLEGRLEG